MSTSIDNKKSGTLPNHSHESSGYIDRFSRIINAALRRTFDAENFFAKSAQKSANDVKKSFFSLLSERKASQRIIIDKIRRSFGVERVNTKDGSKMQNRGVDAHSEEDFRIIFESICEKTVDELDFYINFLSVEKHPMIISLLLMCADLQKDFLFEARVQYFEHQSKTSLSSRKKIGGYFSATGKKC